MADLCPSSVWAPKALSYTTSVLSMILCVTTSSGNFLIILATIKDPHSNLKTPFCFFLLNLSVCDFIVGIITLPISSATHILEADGVVNRTHWIIIHLSYFISTTASVLSMVMMCLDRYQAVVINDVQRRQPHYCKCVAISVGVWFLAVLFSMLYLILGFLTLLTIFVHISVVLTSGITILTYIKVMRKVRHSGERLSQMSGTDGNSSSTNSSCSGLRWKMRTLTEVKITKTFLAILVSFLASYVPALVFIYILQFCIRCDCDTQHILEDSGALMVVSNSCINPLVCYFRMKPYRQAIKTILGFKTQNQISSWGMSAKDDSRKEKLSKWLKVKLRSNVVGVTEVQKDIFTFASLRRRRSEIPKLKNIISAKKKFSC